VTHKKLNPIRRFIHWLFGAPFQELPPEFGDPVPSELRVFEAEADQVQHQPQGRVSPQSPDHPEQTKPIRRDESLERE
jgi:hypothetical protein